MKQFQVDVPYKSSLYHRHSIRLPGYDYSQSGAYFVTFVTQDRENRLGSVSNGEIQLNTIGNLVVAWWRKVPEKFSNVTLDEFVIMPNHVHGILWINDQCKDESICLPEEIQTGQTAGFAPTNHPSLSEVVQWFKTMTTNEIIRGIKANNWQPFQGRFWQRNYYEHIIRDDKDLNSIREYILNNPTFWDCDSENSTNL